MVTRIHSFIPWFISVVATVALLVTIGWSIWNQQRLTVAEAKLANTQDRKEAEQAVRPDSEVPDVVSLTVPISKQQAASIETCKILEAPWQTEREISGRIELDPDRHFAVTSPTEVFVRDVYVALGGEVKQGQPLLKLSCPEVAEIRARLATSRQSVGRAQEALNWHRKVEANIKELVESINRNQSSLLDRDWSQVELGKLGGQILEALSNREAAEKIAASMKTASASGALPERLIIESNSKQALAQANLQATIQQTIFDLRQQVLQAENEVASNQRSVDAIQVELDHMIGASIGSGESYQAEPSLDELDTFVYSSSRSGTLIELNFARGERAAAGDIQLLIADISKLWVAGELRPQDWELLSVDKSLPIDVTVLGLERLGKLSGKQVYMGGKVQPNSGAVRIAVEVDNAQNLLRPGMFAQLKFKQPSKELCRILPMDAVFTNDGHDFIVVKQGDEKFDVVHVELGRRSNDRVELLTDITLDATIVSKGVMAIASDAILEEE